MGEKGMKNREELQQEILEILRGRKSPKIMRDELDEYHASDLAAALDEINLEERERFYRLQSDEDLAEVLEHSDYADKYLGEMSLHRAASVLTRMEPDVAVDLMKESDSVKKKEWLELMDPESRAKLQSLASFDEDLIASRMTTNFVWLYSNMTVREGMKSLVEQAEEHDNISVIYVLDPQGVFYGAINLKDLIIARRDTELSDIIMTQFPYVYADERIEDCLWIIRDYYEESIPVLSSDNHILGAITSQEIAEVVGDEMGEDYAKLAGLSAEEDLNEPLRMSIKKRLPWLILLLGLGMVVSSVVGLFEGVVAQLTIVMAFQSLILDMAGNVGTQSLAVTIRALMDDQLTPKQKLKLLTKEVNVGTLNGIILGLLAFVGVGLYVTVFKGMPVHYSFAISGCIGISLVVAMLISSLVGTAVPIFFKHIHIDPAAASGPLITTITDLVGVVTYYGLAWLLLIEFIHL